MTAETENRTPPARKAKAGANAKPSGYGLIVAVIVAIGVALVVFVTTSGGQSELTIGKVTAAPEKYENRKLRVVGTIKQGSTKSLSSNGKSETQFALIDELGNELTVVYHQALPDPYKEGRSAIVEGTYASNTTGGIVEANKLTVKCPSKYQSEDGTPMDNDDYKKRYMTDSPSTPGPRS